MRKGEWLPNDRVEEIREYWRMCGVHRYPRSYRSAGDLFDVSHMTIARIVRGETYKGVK